jgi:hypothetical protein
MQLPRLLLEDENATLYATHARSPHRAFLVRHGAQDYVFNEKEATREAGRLSVRALVYLPYTQGSRISEATAAPLADQ